MKTVNQSAFASYMPTLLIMITVIVGVIYSNARITDLRSLVEASFSDFGRRMEDLNNITKTELKAEISELRFELKTEIAGLRSDITGLRSDMGKVERGLERLEAPRLVR